VLYNYGTNWIYSYALQDVRLLIVFVNFLPIGKGTERERDNLHQPQQTINQLPASVILFLIGRDQKESVIIFTNHSNQSAAGVCNPVSYWQGPEGERDHLHQSQQPISCWRL
jgi:hypothetical protein